MDIDEQRNKSDRDQTLIFVVTTVILPVLIQVLLAIFIASPMSYQLRWIALEVVFSGIAAIVAFTLGLLWVPARLSDNFLLRYRPIFVPCFYYLLVWIGAMFISGGDFTHSVFSIVFFLYLPFIFINFLALFSGQYWLFILIPLFCYAFLAAGLVVRAKRRGKTVAVARGRRTCLAIFSLLLAVTAGQGYLHKRFLVREEDEQTFTETISLKDRAPFTADNRLIPLSSPATLAISSDWPRVDGATAAYPVYASAVQALYKGLDEHTVFPYIAQSRTSAAYRALIANRADLIFVAQPSILQKQMAAENNLKLRLIPVAKEAFVFIVDKDNPVTNLSVEQLRAIYSGEIDNWRKVGGPWRKIIPWQRPEGSGSQTVMLDKVMKGIKMRPPLKTEVAGGMGGIARRVADYQHSPGSLGYSFRFYVSQMDRQERLRLLSVNGIAPTPENIRNGSYPFTVELYMVTVRQPSLNTQKLIDWFLSPQGQKLIADTGYVPIGPVE